MGRRKTEYLISIDGSTTNTGISVFNKNNEDLILHTVISPENPIKATKKNTKEEKKIIKKTNMDYRIDTMISEILKIFKDYKPSVILMEDTYGGKDMYAYKKLCHLQGLVLSYSIEHDIEFQLKFPSHWRTQLGIPIIEDKVRLKREDFKKKAIDLVNVKYNILVNDDEAESICLGLSYFK